MKPITSQDTKWTWLQTTQGPKHQHAKLRRLGRLPTRPTQPERYSRSPGQHDLSVQIRRLKRPLMTKVWLPKLWASTILSIWIRGSPNSDKGARRYDSRNFCCAVSPKSEQIIFQGRFALFGVRTWEIWRRKGRAPNEENLDEADFMETKFASLPRISCKAS
jgi:hypothetical protein